MNIKRPLNLILTGNLAGESQRALETLIRALREEEAQQGNETAREQCATLRHCLTNVLYGDAES